MNTKAVVITKLSMAVQEAREEGIEYEAVLSLVNEAFHSETITRVSQLDCAVKDKGYYDRIQRFQDIIDEGSSS